LLQLHAQGLLQPSRRRARREDLVAAIERMHLLQIDTIHVVARSPYLVLYARLGDYPPPWLDEALADGRLAECWGHEACFVPSHEYALHDAWREQRAGHWAHRSAARMHGEHRVEMDRLLERIRRDGPVRASDFTRDDPGVKGWWAWKPEKRWLEAWFALGRLMVARRERFQRVYDLAERVREGFHPSRPAASPAPTAVALRRHFILESVRALGVVPARWMADYYRLKPAVTDRELKPLTETGELVAIAVVGWSMPGYVHAEHLPALAKARAGRLRATHTAFLSPFDPLVWDRERLQGMFGFEYALECYTPAPKRRFGYFVLPILHRGELVGRMDAKVHRTEGVFEIKSAYLEPGVQPEPRLCAELAQAIKAFAAWHGAERIRIGSTTPAALGRALRNSALLRP
jgi:uncharacterized protein YcaQ